MANTKMMKKTLLIGLILTLSFCVQADDLADWQYEKAAEAYNGGNCKNASVHAEIAFDRYTTEGNTVGMTKTSELIKDINNCLRSLGESYYIQISDYTIRARNYLDSNNYEAARTELETARTYLFQANSSYSYMLPPNPSLIDKVDAEYLKIAAAMKEADIQEAHDFYEKARDSREKEDVVSAMTYIDKACSLYQKHSDVEGLSKCSDLKKSISDLTIAIIQRADYLYEKGGDFYSTANCTNGDYFEAMDNYKQARNFYLVVNLTKRAQDSAYMMSLTNTSIDRCAEDMKAEILGIIDQARQVRILPGNCSKFYKALGLAERAERLNDDLIDRFAGNPNQGLFYPMKKTCEDLIKDIKDEILVCEGVYDAMSIYNNASALFALAEYEQALVLTQKARDLFEENGDYGGVTQCDKLIDQINDRLKLKNEAEAYYNKSLEYLGLADFKSAEEYALKARSTYMSIGRQSEVFLCNQTMLKIQEGNSTKNEADTYLEEAERAQRYGDSGNACRSAKEAKDRYNKIHYSEGEKDAEEIMNQTCSQDSQSTPMIPLLIVGTLLFVLLIWGRTKTRKGKEEVEEAAMVKRREKERLKAESDEQKRKREAEKRKMMEERVRIKEVLDSEKKARLPKKGEPLETERKAPVADSGEESKIHRLDDLLDMERESISKERSSLSDQIEWEKTKTQKIVDRSRDVLGLEEKASIDDIDKLKGIIEEDEKELGIEGENQEMAGEDITGDSEIKDFIRKERKNLKGEKD